MKSIFIFFFLLFVRLSLQAQQPVAADTALLGVYRATGGLSFTFDVYRDGNQLKLQIVGQGTTGLKRLSALSFEPEHIRPRAKMEFRRDSTGRIDRLHWSQGSRTYKWIRIAGDPNGFSGDYQLPVNPYRILHVRKSQGKLMSRVGDEPEMELSQGPKDHFLLKGLAGEHSVSFHRDKRGLIHELTTTGEDVLDFSRVSSTPPHVSNRINGFTRADTLHGALTPLRSCYDVLFYDLDVTVLPETKRIRGSNVIRFRAVRDFDRMQIDLHANLRIDRIVYHGQELSYTREYNAVYIGIPGTIKEGSIDSLKVVYDGEPLEPDLLSLQGGIFWLSDRENKFWISSVTQGMGANLFWPCKDHLSDRPDSMRISVTIPNGLEEISNGRLLQKIALPDSQTRFIWYVDYPIVTYDVAINIGDYIHFTDVYTGDHDTLNLNFYSLRYNLDYARWMFGDIKRMLALYEKDFGPYPFPRDGFNILESIYPMDHQGAVDMGPLNNPVSSHHHDSADQRRTMWHESSHEWWGNSVGCSDYADMWIHESFADYSEFLNKEALDGRQAALNEWFGDHPDNKEPIIGVYNVNHFHMGDMYLKGSLLLATLRDVINNDSLWFSIFRGIQQRFKYQPVRTEDIVGYFNQASGVDYTYFFDQYLRYPHIPVLVLKTEAGGDGINLSYRWEADVPGFRMPVKVTVAKDSMAFIYPTTSWQTIKLKGMAPDDFQVDTKEFYVGVRKE